MIEVRQTEEFTRWLKRLRDQTVRGILTRRIARMRDGNFGDSQSVGEGVFEMRVHLGPGFRIYYVMHSLSVVILLCGGDKSSQSDDIRKAKQIARLQD